MLEEVANKGIYYIPYTIHKTDNKKYIERINPIVDVSSEDINNYIDAIMWCINQNKQEPQYRNNKLLIHFAMTDESNYSNYNDIYDNSFYKLRNANIFQELDIREDKVKSDSQLSCGRTNRSELRNSYKNERIYRGRKISKGRVTTRKSSPQIQSGDLLLYQNVKYECLGVVNYGNYVSLKGLKKQPSSKVVKVLKRTDGWKLINAV